jgi:hypothetical protein
MQHSETAAESARSDRERIAADWRASLQVTLAEIAKARISSPRYLPHRERKRQAIRSRNRALAAHTKLLAAADAAWYGLPEDDPLRVAIVNATTDLAPDSSNLVRNLDRAARRGERFTVCTLPRVAPVQACAARRSTPRARRPHAASTRSSARSGDSPAGDPDSDAPAGGRRRPVGPLAPGLGGAR